VWFIIVQKWIVGSFCPYCMAAHITGLLLATLIIWQAPKQLDNSSTEAVLMKSASVPAVPRRVIGRLPTMGFASIGLVLAGIVALCQATITPPPKYRAGESNHNLPVIDTRNAPLIGSPDAPYVVNLLFDYKCPHCQELHFMLNEAVRRYGGKLAFVLCPTPLNTRCNPYIPQDLDEFTNSCELAKIALTVWVAKREAFPAFDLWMFSQDSGDRWQPRSLEAANAKAVELVGQAKFDAAQSDPWIERYLQTSIAIYGDTVQSASNPRRANAVPKMVFGSRWVIPEPNDADDLMMILQNSLGVPKP
jgi:protein-disulfide isomerase